MLGATEPTFRVEGHHYALVRVEGLKPATEHPYDVRLDGEVRWPEPDSPLPPPACARSAATGPLDVAFGSCRVAVPHEEPYTKSKDDDERGHEVDALWVLAQEIIRDDARRPDLLFLLGDQVYVDEGSPETRAKIEARRGTETAPGREVTDFEEYTWLYQESWREPLIRWLFANVSTSMLWDDHDMSDDWNISHSWVEEMRERAWWHRRAIGCIASYWIYQHLGNLSPRRARRGRDLRAVRGNQHAEEVLFDWAERIESTGAGARWSFCRDLGGTRAIFVDSRAGRVLDEGAPADGRRRGVGLDRRPDRGRLRPPAGRDDGALAPLPRPRPARGLEREGLRRRPGRGRARPPRSCAGPSTSTTGAASATPSGRCATCSAKSPRRARRRSRPRWSCWRATSTTPTSARSAGRRARPTGKAPIYQAVCSPYRNPLSSKEQRVIRAGFSRAFTRVAAALAKPAGAEDPGIRWRLRDGPCFDNQVATLHIDGRDGDDAPRQDDPRRPRPGDAGDQLRAPARLSPAGPACGLSRRRPDGAPAALEMGGDASDRRLADRGRGGRR